jgi:hypothetical protein
MNDADRPTPPRRLGRPEFLVKLEGKTLSPSDPAARIFQTVEATKEDTSNIIQLLSEPAEGSGNQLDQLALAIDQLSQQIEAHSRLMETHAGLIAMLIERTR